MDRDHTPPDPRRVRVGVNGFGRIGRVFTRVATTYAGANVEVVAINDPGTTADAAAYLFNHDSVYGTLEHRARADGDDGLYLRAARGGSETRVALSREREPRDIDWASAGVDVVVDASGKFLSRADAGAHLLPHPGVGPRRGPQKVIVTAPMKDAPAYVVGVNEHTYAADGFPDVLSNASCTTNCLAPLLKIVHGAFGIESAVMTTIHAATASQPPVDGVCLKDPRRGRSCLLNIIPTTTGAAKAIGAVMPDLAGKVTGLATRVPTAAVSLVDVSIQLTNPASMDEIRTVFMNAANGDMLGIVKYVDEPVVSTDFTRDPSSCVFDATSSTAASPTHVKLLAWYDNEWGYACRVLDLIAHVRSAEDARNGARREKVLERMEAEMGANPALHKNAPKPAPSAAAG